MRNLKKLLALTLVLAFVVSIALPAMARDISDFPDAVQTEEYLADKGDLADAYKNAAQLMVDLGVVQGHTGATADRGLDLAGKLTRGQFAALLYRAVTGSDYKPAWLENADPFFGDTPAGSWFTPYATWMGVQGISEGMSYNVNGKPAFEPDTPINFSMAALLCMRALGFDDEKENFTYSEVAALMQALNYGILNNVAGADEDQVDRGNAFVLIENTVRAQRFSYIASVGAGLTVWERNYLFNTDGTRNTYLRNAFGIIERDFTILSDAAWFAIDGTDGTVAGNLSEVVLEYISHWTGNTPNYLSRVLDGAAAEKLGIDMYDVGRNVTIFYRAPATSGPNANVIMQTIGAMRYNDSVGSWDGGVGATGGPNGEWNGRLASDFAAIAGVPLRMTANTRYFENYTEGNSWHHRDHTNYTNNDFNWWPSDSIRIIYRDREVTAIFSEGYTYSRFARFNNDGNFVIDTSRPYDQELNGVHRDLVRGAGELVGGQRFVYFPIGDDEPQLFGIREYEFAVVEGTASRFHNDDKEVTIGGNTYELSWIESLVVPGWDNSMVGNAQILHLFLGDVVERAGPPVAPPNFAVITAARLDRDGWTGNYDITVRLLLADGATREAKVTSGGWPDYNSDAGDLCTSHGPGCSDEGLECIVEDIVDTLVIWESHWTGRLNVSAVVGDHSLPSADITGGWNAQTKTGTGMSRVEVAWWNGSLPGHVAPEVPVFIRRNPGDWVVFTGGTVPEFTMNGMTSAYTKAIDGNNRAVDVEAVAFGGWAQVAAESTSWAVSTGITDRKVIDHQNRDGLWVINSSGEGEWLYFYNGFGTASPIGTIFAYDMSGGLARNVAATGAADPRLEGARPYEVLGELEEGDVDRGAFRHEDLNTTNNSRWTNFSDSMFIINGDHWDGNFGTATPAQVRDRANSNRTYTVHGFQTANLRWHWVFVRDTTAPEQGAVARAVGQSLAADTSYTIVLGNTTPANRWNTSLANSVSVPTLTGAAVTVIDGTKNNELTLRVDVAGAAIPAGTISIPAARFTAEELVTAVALTSVTPVTSGFENVIATTYTKRNSIFDLATSTAQFVYSGGVFTSYPNGTVPTVVQEINIDPTSEAGKFLISLPANSTFTLVDGKVTAVNTAAAGNVSVHADIAGATLALTATGALTVTGSANAVTFGAGTYVVSGLTATSITSAANFTSVTAGARALSIGHDGTVASAGALTITAGTVTVTTAGSLQASGGTVTLDGNVTGLVDLSVAINTNTAAAIGSLRIRSTMTLLGSAVLTVNGTTTIDAGAELTLNNVANVFTGTITGAAGSKFITVGTAPIGAATSDATPNNFFASGALNTPVDVANNTTYDWVVTGTSNGSTDPAGWEAE